MRMKWAGICSTYMGEKHIIGYHWESLKEGHYLENLGVDGGIILNRFLRK